MRNAFIQIHISYGKLGIELEDSVKMIYKDTIWSLKIIWIIIIMTKIIKAIIVRVKIQFILDYPMHIDNRQTIMKQLLIAKQVKWPQQMTIE